MKKGLIIAIIVLAIVGMVIGMITENMGLDSGEDIHSASSGIEGQWVCDGESYHNYPQDMELYADGTGIADSHDLTWAIVENKLVLYIGSSELDYRYEVDGDTLFLDEYSYHRRESFDEELFSDVDSLIEQDAMENFGKYCSEESKALAECLISWEVVSVEDTSDTTKEVKMKYSEHDFFYDYLVSYDKIIYLKYTKNNNQWSGKFYEYGQGGSSYFDIGGTTWTSNTLNTSDEGRTRYSSFTVESSTKDGRMTINYGGNIINLTEEGSGFFVPDDTTHIIQLQINTSRIGPNESINLYFEASFFNANNTVETYYKAD